jgi:hypothetical protein
VIPQTNDLAALIRRRLEELGDRSGPMSRREAARRSRGKISDFHLGNLINGTANPAGISNRIAEGIAAAIDVSIDEVFAAAHVARPMSRWVLPERFDRLPEAKRRLVEELAAALLHSYDEGRDGTRWGGPTGDIGRPRSTRK